MTRQERMRRSSRFGAVERLEGRDLMTIAATAPLPNVNVTAGSAAAQVNLDNYFKDADNESNYAMVDTSLGTIPVLLTPQTTPLTVANFENYINKGSYTNSIVHRSVPGFIWQTGGYSVSSTSNGVTPITADAPVKNEFGASNVRGTIAMAKLGSDPNSATDQFFFNESDSNASNLDNQNGGFTVFGHVVGDQGLAVMDAVAAVPLASPAPLASPLDQIPLQNYTSGKSVLPSNLVLIKDVTLAHELFTTASSAPGVATVAVQGSNLVINPVGAGTAQVTVTGYGADGTPVAQSFSVNVAPGTGTTTTTTSTAGAATPVAATPASVLIPTTLGALPTSAVSGGKVKLHQTVLLSSPTTTVNQKEFVSLSLSPTTIGTPNDVMLLSASVKVKLKPGKQTRVNLGGSHAATAPAAGTYHILVSVTDPDGAKTTLDTGKTLTVRDRLGKA